MLKHPCLPLIAIPTTAGTSSEITNVSALIDTQKVVKYVVIDDRITPSDVIADPEFTRTAPAGVTAATGMDAITHAVKEVSSRHTVTLVESAGGMDVPLTENTLSSDYAALNGWPLILVTCGRLGSINHTLLSIEAALRRGMRVAGVIHNWCAEADPKIDADAEETVRRYLAAWDCRPVVVRVPRVADYSSIPDVDFTEIFA